MIVRLLGRVLMFLNLIEIRGLRRIRLSLVVPESLTLEINGKRVKGKG